MTTDDTALTDAPDERDDWVAPALPDQMSEALARPDFGNLAVLLRYATRGSWVFAIYNNAQAREQVMAALRDLVQPLPVYEWTYSPDSPFPINYLDRLTPEQRNARGVVFIFDLERADPGIWKSLDYGREQYALHPHSLVVWMSPQGRTSVPRMAPHFWSQRSGVFDFSLAPIHQSAFQAEALRTTHDADIRIEDREDMERQLRLYQGLLDEAQADINTPPGILADLHTKVAQMQYYTDHTASAKHHAQQALALRSAQPNPRGVADSHRVLGDLALREDDLKRAHDEYEAALPILQTIGDRLGEASTHRSLGDLTLRENDLKRARAEYQAALAIFQTIGSSLGAANTHQSLGELALREDDLKSARAEYEAALSIYQTIGSILGAANTHRSLGELALHEDDPKRARAEYEAALPIYQTIGQRLGEANTRKALGDLALREADLKRARAEYEAALPIYQTIGARLGEANTRLALGDLALLEGNRETAQQWVEQALSVFTEIGEKLSEANSYRLLGRITDDAAWFEKALALHTKIESNYDVAADKFYYAHLKLKQGDATAAAELFADARDIWQQIGPAHLAQEAERQRQRAMLDAIPPTRPDNWQAERATRRKQKRALENQGVVSRIFRALGWRG